MPADGENGRKPRMSMFQRLQGLQEGAGHEPQSTSRGKRRSVSDVISAPSKQDGNHAGGLIALFAEMRKQNATKNTDEVLDAEFQDPETTDRIWYIEGTIPNKWFFLRFGSALDMFAFQTLRFISLLDTMAVPVMLTFGRVTWLAHMKEMFPIIMKIDILVGICYFLGTVRRLITSTVDLDQAKEFVELKVIMDREIRKNTFWYDILSMPGHLWWLDGCRVLCVFRLLRCWRILPNERDRCYQIATGKIENFRSTTIKLTFYLVVVAHYLACGWFYAVMWPFNDMKDLMAVNADYWGSDLFSQYMSTLASGMAMLVGWTGPSASHPDGFTNVELAYNAVASPISGVFLAYVVGGLLLALERAAHERDMFLHKMDNVEHVMASLGLPMDTRRRVVKYHTYLNLHHIEKDAYSSLFGGLSSHLHKEIQLIMYESLIISAPFLQQVPVDVLVNIVTAFNNEVFSPGDTIVKKGEIGNELFFIVKGSCQVLAEFEGTTVLAEKHVGDYFGEVAIVMDAPRNAWIKAKTFSVLAVLPKTAFDHAVKSHPQVKDIMIGHIMNQGAPTTPSPTNTTPLLADSANQNGIPGAAVVPVVRQGPATDESRTMLMLKGLEAQIAALSAQVSRIEHKG